MSGLLLLSERGLVEPVGDFILRGRRREGKSGGKSGEL
jgi:hypothetical protein